MIQHLRATAWLFLIFSYGSLFAQVPQSAYVSEWAPATDKALVACADQFAGTVTVTPAAGNQSNDPQFLCFNDVLNVVHNGNQNLTGDPNPATLPGITYTFASCPTTVTGPTTASGIAADPCLITIPPPTGPFWVTGSNGTINGNLTITNNGQVQTFFNAGNPIQVYYTPVTIDNFAANQYEGAPATQCVHHNTAATFPVVYLNAIQASNITYLSGVLGGSFQLNGGLPQYNGSNYTITISLASNPAVTGTITSGPATHGSTVSYTVPQSGVYNVIISDGKSCDATFQISLPAVNLNISSAVVASGGNVCVNMSVANFTGMTSMNILLNYNPALLTFTGPAGLNLTGLTAGNITTPAAGQIAINWNSPGAGITLANNTNIFQLCFTAVGPNGAIAPISFSNIPTVTATSGTPGVAVTGGSISIAVGGFGISVTTDSISCGETPPLSDGSLYITTIGGAAPYTFSWAGITNGLSGSGTINVIAGSATVSGLPAGTYGVTVTTAFGQQQTTTAVIASAAPLFVNLVATNPTCPNLSNGSVSINTFGGGVGPYNILWNVGFPGSTTLSNLGQGNYDVTVTDSRGCTRVASSSIGVNPILITGSNIVQATCSGINNGSVQILGVNGGTPAGIGNYTFTWSNGSSNVGTTSTINGLALGTYTVTVSDVNNCTTSSSFVVTASKLISLNVLTTDPTCFNGTNGFITAIGVTVGAVPAIPYTFTWSPNVPAPVNNPTSTLAPGIGAGTYSVTVIDQDGCTKDTTLTLTQPTQITIGNSIVNNESCTVASAGSINIVGVSGGTGNYSYAWSAPLGVNTPTNSGLTAGVYTVTVSDANGCTLTTQYTILPPQPPVITGFVPTVPTCANLNNGVLSVSVTQGAANITNYQWVTPGGNVPQTGATLNGIGANTYTVTVSDAAGCTASSSFVLVGPDPLVVNPALVSPTCPGLSNGAINLQTNGGTSPYTFQLVGGSPQTGSVFPGLTAGTYNFLVTDANNCPPINLQVVLTDPPAISVSFSGIDSVSCGGQQSGCNGTATATASGGPANNGVYNFIWQSGQTGTGTQHTAFTLCAGQQFVIVNDGICGDTFYVNIPAPPILSASANVSPASCFDVCDGTIDVLPAGGTPPYILTWSTGISTNPQSNLCAGLYTILVTDSKGCNYVVNATVTQPDLLIANINQNNTNDMSCHGLADGQISVTYSGGNFTLGNYTFSWSPPVGSTETVINLNVGTYTVTVSDPLGCSSSISYTITQPDPIVAIIPTPELPLCNGFQTTITVDTAYGGNGGPFFFRVDYGPEFELGLDAPLYAGDHIISIVDIGNSNECVLDTTIFVNEPPPINVDLGPDIVVELGASHTFSPVISSGLPIDYSTVKWTPTTYLTFGNDPRYPTTTPVVPITYELSVSDFNGCSGTDAIFVDVDRNRNIFIPNAFSPNDDDINDLATVYMGIGVREVNHFRIYDRWGNKMYEATKKLPGDVFGWDGTYRGQLMAPQVFTYICEVTFQDNVTLLFKGDITLIRL